MSGNSDNYGIIRTMLSNSQLHPQSTEHGWDEHNLWQLRYFRSLSLREKLQAVVGMADVVRHLRQIRAQGGFKAGSQQADESHGTRGSASPQVADPLSEADSIAHGLETSRRTVAQAARERAAARPSSSDPPQGRSQHGVRGGTGEPEDAGGRAQSPHPTVRFIETTLGIQSHVELAPRVALRVLTLEADIADGRFSNRALGEDLIWSFTNASAATWYPERPDAGGARMSASVTTKPRLTLMCLCSCRTTAALEVRITALAGTLDDRTLECLAFAEGRLLWIHPFEDFNGHVTRAFLAELLQRLGMPAPWTPPWIPTWTPNAICKRCKSPTVPIGGRWSRSGAVVWNTRSERIRRSLPIQMSQPCSRGRERPQPLIMGTFRPRSICSQEASRFPGPNRPSCCLSLDFGGSVSELQRNLRTPARYLPRLGSLRSLPQPMTVISCARAAIYHQFPARRWHSSAWPKTDRTPHFR
jgi:hypothetical protein